MLSMVDILPGTQPLISDVRQSGGSCLGALVGGASSVLPGLAVLCACGFLDGLGRRESAVRAAVLAGIGVPGRARLGLRAAHVLRAARASPAEVAAPLLAVVADGARGRLCAVDRELMAHTARGLFEDARVLRERGQAARGASLLRAARRLIQRVAGAASPVRGRTAEPAW